MAGSPSSRNIVFDLEDYPARSLSGLRDPILNELYTEPAN